LLLKLHRMLERKSDFGYGSYRFEIHEMTEFRAGAMGLYGHNNQPSHHILYLFSLLGEQKTTQKFVREVINRAYGVDFYAGDVRIPCVNIHHIVDFILCIRMLQRFFFAISRCYFYFIY
jgi:hypothetical protein